ncbi:MAG: hypothetical protein IJA16_01355, partial [Clostridia bacterium]|nr:hypothetical protein [Clostridia bacterium]
MSSKNRKRKNLRLKARLRLYSMKNLRKQSNNRATFFIYQTLTMLVILVLIVQAIRGRYENCFTCGLTLILFLIPNFVESRLKITLPQTLEIIIILFIFSAEILGEISAFYIKFRWWDTMLHTMNGFLMAAIGFSMVDILNKNDRFKFRLSPVFMAIVSFCFSMTVGVLWEFFEFFMDLVFSTDMQKDIVLSNISSVDLNLNQLNIPVIVEGIDNVVATGKNLTVDGSAASDGVYSLGLGGYLDIGLIDTMGD